MRQQFLFLAAFYQVAEKLAPDEVAAIPIKRSCENIDGRAVLHNVSC
jgi:hypothetical protein